MAEHVAVLRGGWSAEREVSLRSGAAGAIALPAASSLAGLVRDGEGGLTKGGPIHICPAQILPKIYQQIEEWTLTAHQAIGCRGVSRSDLRYDDESGAFVRLETDTRPGTTEPSLMPDLAAHAGLNFGELVGWIVADASLDR